MKAIISLAVCLVVASVLYVSASFAQSNGHVIGAEDVLDIVVTNHEELNKTVTVLEDGTITLSEVGTIMVAGKTTKEVASEIKTALSRTRKKVEVYVAAKEIHSQNVRVLGAVKIPGPYELKPDWRVMDLVDSAGGLTQRPNKIVARLVRNRNQIISIDLQKADYKRDTEANPALMRDDLVILDEAEVAHPMVLVEGSVTKPGMYELDDQTTVLSVLTLAGLPTEKAALNNAYVTRNGKQIRLDLTNTVHGVSDPVVASFKFQSGDVLWILENQIHISVQGAVVKPGQYPIPESGEIKAFDAFNLAGGSTTGNISKAGVLRSVDGKTKVIPVNIDRMLNKGDMTDNIVLKADDILYIPPITSHRFDWQKVLVPLAALGVFGLHF